MQPRDAVLIQQLAAVPLTDAERARALELVAQGEAIADTCIALARLFQREPKLAAAH